MFNTTFKNISVTTFVAEIGVPREIQICRKSVVYGYSSVSICGGATGRHVPCPEVCSAHAQPEVAPYPP